MSTCNKCRFWAPIEHSDKDGTCDRIHAKIYPDITYGTMGGKFNAFETERDFGCNLFEAIGEAPK